MAWLGNLNRDGYGTLTIGGKFELAHRVAFMQTAGRRCIPSQQQINHKCNRPYCVQPAHLYAGTTQDNSDDARMFRSPDWVSAAEKVLMFPDKDWPEETLMHRIKASRRNEIFAVWEGCELPQQAKMLDAPCPGHNFTIPINPNGYSKACRICGAFEPLRNRSSRFAIVAIAEEIYPVTQYVDRLLAVVLESVLANDQYSAWRENVSSRCGILVLPRNGEEKHPPLRYCDCFPCRHDRAELWENLQPHLTSLESAILSACDRIEPAIRAAVYRARGNALATIAHSQGWKIDEVEALREHLPRCVNTEDEARKTALAIEGVLGFALYAMQSDLRTADSTDSFRYRTLPFLVRSYRSTVEKHAVLLDEVQRTTATIVNTWTSETRELKMRHATGAEEKVGHIFETIRLFISAAILEQLKLDCFSSNISSSQWPHVHQSCIDYIFDR